MQEPNFGECQLQQCINTEITLWAWQEHGLIISAIVPTLPEEYVLGWDSGFFFPWIPFGPLSDNKGCNFFLQYKLSTLVEGARGGQYACWSEPYFRFQIPHRKKEDKQYIDDYHQYEALRALAQNDCKSYYATNSVTKLEELLALSESQNLINNTPFLDVCDVTDYHYYVTFTAASPHFLLHSQAKTAQKTTLEQIREHAFTGETRTLDEDNALVFASMNQALSEVGWGKIFFRMYRRIEEQSKSLSSELRPQIEFFFLQSALMRFFNIAMIRFLRANVSSNKRL